MDQIQSFQSYCLSPPEPVRRLFVYTTLRANRRTTSDPKSGPRYKSAFSLYTTCKYHMSKQLPPIASHYIRYKTLNIFPIPLSKYIQNLPRHTEHGMEHTQKERRLQLNKNLAADAYQVGSFHPTPRNELPVCVLCRSVA